MLWGVLDRFKGGLALLAGFAAPNLGLAFPRIRASGGKERVVCGLSSYAQNIGRCRLLVN